MRRVTGRSDHVLVVGGGLAGLSAALHLRGSGREVTVVEREPHPGGRAGRLDVDGFRLDTGPTVLTMPELIDEALHAVGDSLDRRLELLPLHPAYRARFADGSSLDVHTGAEAMAEEVRRFAGPAEAQGYLRLREWLGRLYAVERDRFIGANFDSPLDLAGASLAKLAAMGGFGRLGPAVGRFIRDPRLRRVFSFQSLYAGVPPQRALAAYAVIAYMDTVAGVWFPRGGMRALPQAMAEAAAAAGVRFRYGETVESLEGRGGRVLAAHTATDRITCDAVVLTTDLAATYDLLGHQPRRPVPLRWSPSAVVVHLAAEQTSPDLAHHTISFGEAWEQTFAEITSGGRLMSDPSLLLTTPSLTDPTLAPPGRAGHFLLAPCPNLADAPLEWDRIGPHYAEEIVTVLAKRGLLPDRAAVTRLSLVTPADWARQGLSAGTPFSLAHTFAQTGPFRPGNLPRAFANVVLAGAGTTPGVGIPPVLISGRLAAQRITG
ncbi:MULTISPECIES: phytoene desaturase family protein [unclassified Crossiella]|uniref:phytoene desaturase family protein n=1 Tax=unclassified Crossiella TaxID=2620835 RepID=UPI001FFF6F44|nr:MULTISPECIES: phytoene desaturase family protein [unclassified Crossiella]MCK2238613.1 phytoene desaturase family protein [Crossiella sp. S99.2]MCK2251817.1 phytoene desaturase family protein [Crossiella sp. S99.1]